LVLSSNNILTRLPKQGIVMQGNVERLHESSQQLSTISLPHWRKVVHNWAISKYAVEITTEKSLFQQLVSLAIQSRLTRKKANGGEQMLNTASDP